MIGKIADVEHLVSNADLIETQLRHRQMLAFDQLQLSVFPESSGVNDWENLVSLSQFPFLPATLAASN